MKEPSSITVKNLIFLLFVFISGILLLVFVNISFKNFIANLDKQTINLKTKIEISKYIVNDLNILKIGFYELATVTTNKRSRELIVKKLQYRMNLIKKSLEVLEKGGELNREIILNVPGHNQTIKKINFVKQKKNISLETIDLVPKLNQFTMMVRSLQKFLEEKERYMEAKDLKNLIKINKKINRFYKVTPSFFKRITENTNRLLYESSLQLDSLKKVIQNEKKYYTKIEIVLIICIILITLLLGYIISRQIEKNSKKLFYQQRSIRGILDGQPNIVVVSNGEYMLDANVALVDFFDDYETFSDFQEKHLCICDFFENVNSPDYLIDVYKDGTKWFEKIFENSTKQYRVAMKSAGKLFHFNISAKKKYLNEEKFIIIIVLNDITNEIKIQKELKNFNEHLEEIVDEKTKELQGLNISLEKRIAEEVNKNREKDKQLIQQSRFAALGEMIGNIAHQWRQPLSAISSIASGKSIQLELDLIDNEEIKKSYKDIIKYVNFLSNTIEEFRTFFIKEKEKSNFDISEALNNTIFIAKSSYKNSGIDLIFTQEDKYENICIYGFQNELIQVFLNILNNAKDALVEQVLDVKIVKIDIKVSEDKVFINIYDNANGIKAKIIDKIFDPYFTTKHKKQGTGIGLYMSKEIVEKHMGGDLSVKNKTFKYNNITYKGACFTVQLPKI